MENCVCILRNLSYHVHKEIPGAERFQEPHSHHLLRSVGHQKKKNEPDCHGGKRPKGWSAVVCGWADWKHWLSSLVVGNCHFISRYLRYLSVAWDSEDTCNNEHSKLRRQYALIEISVWKRFKIAQRLLLTPLRWLISLMLPFSEGLTVFRWKRI